VCKVFVIVIFLVCGLLGALGAESYKLTTGETVEGEMLAATANDQGVQIKIGDGQYQRVSWANFSQEDLRTFARNTKLQAFVEPFIEITQEEKIKKTEVPIKQPPRLPLLPHQGLFGAMLSSGLGLFMALVLYAGGIYAGYEVAIFRGQPPLLVCGLSAIPVLGFLVPIGFLCVPTKVEVAPSPAEAPVEQAPEAVAAADDSVNPMQAAGAAHPAGLKLHAEAPEAKSDVPKTVTFQRGQFTFNRRFIETKFPGFFGVVRRDDDRDMVLVIKTARGLYEGQRISRIAANDMHLQVHRGHATEEVLIPFQEIQEIQLKHKDA
jgi:hypothetical protein